MKEKVLIGSGGFAREIMADMGKAMKCFVDDKYWADGLYKISELDSSKHIVLVALGNPTQRKSIINRLPSDIEYWNHISKYAIVLDSLKYFGMGSIICAGSVLTTNIHIGNHVHININCSVGHDSNISDFVTISPGVNISGNVNIGEGVYVGTNASIREKINIHSNSTIGMASGVVKDICDSGLYLGLPSVKKYK